MRSGRTSPDYGFLKYIGSNGYLWSSGVDVLNSITSATAYRLGIGVGKLATADASARWLGIPVRCLASGV